MQTVKLDEGLYRTDADNGVTVLSEHMPGARHWNMHRTRTVDYGIAAYGERVHVLPESEFVMRKGDVVVQLAHFHSWDNTRSENIMIFDMIGGEFPFDEP